VPNGDSFLTPANVGFVLFGMIPGSNRARVKIVCHPHCVVFQSAFVTIRSEKLKGKKKKKLDQVTNTDS